MLRRCLQQVLLCAQASSQALSSSLINLSTLIRCELRSVASVSDCLRADANAINFDLDYLKLGCNMPLLSFLQVVAYTLVCALELLFCFDQSRCCNTTADVWRSWHRFHPGRVHSLASAALRLAQLLLVRQVLRMLRVVAETTAAATAGRGRATADDEIVHDEIRR